MEVTRALFWWSLILQCWLRPLVVAGAKRAGKCIEPPTNRSTIEEICSSPAHYQQRSFQTGKELHTEWHLYPVDYEPLTDNGLQGDTFFRIGGISWRCMDLVVRCLNQTRLLLTLSCQNANATYAIDLVRSGHSNYQHGDRCCAMSLQIPTDARAVLEPLGKKCNHDGQEGYELWGDPSRLLLVQVCDNLLQGDWHAQGYWLFVAQNGDVAEIKRALGMLLQHYPFLRLHSWTTSLANKDRCDCASFDKYIQQRMRCNSPMFDRYNTERPRMLVVAMRPVSIKTIHLTIPMTAYRVMQGLIVMNGLFWIYTFAVRRNMDFEL
uniref:Uncharacterized protein n=1 Tax=Anopheles farauti TaxID=69004 RepID=A0A182QTA5_9DIPT